MRRLMLCFFLFSSLLSVGQENFTVSFNLKSNQSVSSKLVDIKILNLDLLPSEINDNRIIFKNITKGNYQAAIQVDGFSSKIVSFTVTKDTDVSVELDPSYKNLGDVTVSANKRDLNLQLVPGSITSLSAKQIKDMRIWEMSDLSGVAPNFYLANSGDNRNVTAIRGITTTSYEQAVVTYIDGVAQFNLDTYNPQLNNKDHIEIIREAQGTLY